MIIFDFLSRKLNTFLHISFFFRFISESTVIENKFIYASTLEIKAFVEYLE